MSGRTTHSACGAALVFAAAMVAGGCLLDLSGMVGNSPDTWTDTGADTGMDVWPDEEADVLPDGDDPPVDTSPPDTATDLADPPFDTAVDDGPVGPDLPPCDGPMTVWYVDADGDDYGDVGGGTEWCAQPPGFSGNHDDCMDTNADVHPDQPDYFPVHRGDGSFDYDCDGTETSLYMTTTECNDWSCDGAGWYAGIPYCGVSGIWRTCTWEWLWCNVQEPTMQQLCK